MTVVATCFSRGSPLATKSSAHATKLTGRLVVSFLRAGQQRRSKAVQQATQPDPEGGPGIRGRHPGRPGATHPIHQVCSNGQEDGRHQRTLQRCVAEGVYSTLCISMNAQVMCRMHLRYTVINSQLMHSSCKPVSVPVARDVTFIIIINYYKLNPNKDSRWM